MNMCVYGGGVILLPTVCIGTDACLYQWRSGDNLVDSFIFTRAQGIEHRSLDLHSKHVYPQRHLASPRETSHGSKIQNVNFVCYFTEYFHA